jgi:hypothetical protein
MNGGEIRHSVAYAYCCHSARPHSRLGQF